MELRPLITKAEGAPRFAMRVFTLEPAGHTPYHAHEWEHEVYVLAGIFFIVVLMPLSIAFAKRIWRRSATVITSLPRELTDRLLRLEQTVEATSLEIERIGEGQRFLTRLFTEGESARALGAGAAKPIEVKPPNVRERLP